jgi:O-antigen/teichoic acid export membrane protein
MARASSLMINSISVRRRPCSWLAHPLGYTIAAPLMMFAGAVTTIIAPMLLQPSEFAKFALLLSVFQYLCDYDLGLSRLMDREFTQRTHAHSLSEFLSVRVCVAILFSSIILVCAFATGDDRVAIAGLSGVMFMLAQGPLLYYRATSNTYMFTILALLLQAGLGIPRLLGLALDGIAGCFVALGIWFAFVTLVSYRPFVGQVRLRFSLPIRDMFRQAFPLSIFGSFWLLYITSSRWVAWFISDETTAGLFSFGINLLLIGVGIINAIVAAYYPKHLKKMDQSALFRELLVLLGVVTVGVMIGGQFCRFALALAFPNFANAVESTALILLSGVPMCACGWLVPMVIARSERPWLEGSVTFGICAVVLILSMWLGYSVLGLNGLAIGVLPSSVLLLLIELHSIVRIGLLKQKQACFVWGGMFLGLCISATAWFAA